MHQPRTQTTSTRNPLNHHVCFFGLKNAAEAKAFVFHNLNIVKNIPIHLPSGITPVICLGCVFWYYLGTPSNFSLFFAPPPIIQSNLWHCRHHHYIYQVSWWPQWYQQWGHQKTDQAEDLYPSDNQPIGAPCQPWVLYHCYLSDVSSYLVSQLSSVLTHIKMNQAIYYDLL